MVAEIGFAHSTSLDFMHIRLNETQSAKLLALFAGAFGNALLDALKLPGIDDMKRTYSNDKITVFWDSDKCIKSGMCDRQLTQVSDVNKHPWVNLDAVDVEEIRCVIDTCPSGALSYVMQAVDDD